MAQDNIERDEAVDYGDEVSPEQAEAIKAKTGSDGNEDLMTDDEVDAAIKALQDVPEEEETDEETDEETSEEETEIEAEASDESVEETRIPKSRFDEAVRKERERANAAEQRLKLYEQQRLNAQQAEQKTIGEQITDQTDAVKDLRSKWQDAIFENDQPAARQYLDELADAEDRLDELKLNATSARTQQETTESIRFEQHLTQLEEDYPIIDETHAAYDAEINRKMTRLYTGLVNSGTSKIEALKEAADVYLAPTKKKGAKDTTLREKAKESLKETLEKQPPEMEGKAGTKAPVLQPSRMTYEQFEKLDERQLAVLRGDEL